MVFSISSDSDSIQMKPKIQNGTCLDIACEQKQSSCLKLHLQKSSSKYSPRVLPQVVESYKHVRSETTITTTKKVLQKPVCLRFLFNQSNWAKLLMSFPFSAFVYIYFSYIFYFGMDNTKSKRVFSDIQVSLLLPSLLLQPPSLSA